MDKFWKLLPYAASAVAIAIAIFFYTENRRQNAMLVDLLQRSQAGGKEGTPKIQDPYMAGPVKNRILKGYSDLKACYRDYLAGNPEKKAGIIRVDWQIETSGRPSHPEVITSEFANRSFEQCLTDKIATWTFPEPPVKKYVEHTFTFGKAAKEKNAPTLKKL